MLFFHQWKHVVLVVEFYILEFFTFQNGFDVFKDLLLAIDCCFDSYFESCGEGTCFDSVFFFRHELCFVCFECDFDGFEESSMHDIILFDAGECGIDEFLGFLFCHIWINKTYFFSSFNRENKKDLKIDSPYNTYRYKGLPPSPISLVGREAIHAALHPEDGKELYFVSKGDGSHYFSETLAEHNRAVVKYQLKKGK